MERQPFYYQQTRVRIKGGGDAGDHVAVEEPIAGRELYTKRASRFHYYSVSVCHVQVLKCIKGDVGGIVPHGIVCEAPITLQSRVVR